MMNVFDYINQYKNSSFTTYGDLLDSNKDLVHGLTRGERACYEELKNADMGRIRMAEQEQISEGRIQMHPENVPGIGKVIQIC